jgi:uncharacterized protein involved in outer membrane biogenesis
MRLRHKILLGCGAALLLTILFIMLILPGIVRTKAIAGIKEATGRAAEIGKVRINPFNLSARVEGFRMAEKEGGITFASFSSVRVRVSPMSLVRRALVIARIDIASPYAHLVRTGPNRYNFSDMMESKKPEKPKSESKFLFSLNNIVITNGSADFQDLAANRPTTHTVRKLELAVPFISNIPYMADKYVSPNFNADINGANFSAKGNLKPLDKSMETSVTLNIKELDLPFYFAYLPVTTPVTIASGKLSTAINISYRISAKEKPDIEIGGEVTLGNIAFKERNSSQIFRLDRFKGEISRINLLSHQFHLASIAVDGPELFLERDGKGVLNLQRLFAANAKEPDKTEKKEDAKGKEPEKKGGKPDKKEQAKLPYVTLASLRLTGGKVHFNDRFPPGGVKSDLEGVTVSIDDFTTEKEKSSRFQVALRTNRKETIDLKGESVVEPLRVKGELKAGEVLLGAYNPYLAPYLTQPVSGTLGLSTLFSYDQENGARIEKLNINAKRLNIPFTKEDGLKLASLNISGVSANLKEQQALVEQVAINGLECNLTRMQDGKFSPQLLAKASAAKNPPAATTVAARPKETKSKPFSYKIAKVTGSGMDISFTDQTREDEPTLTLSRMNISLSNITGPKLQTIPFNATARFGKEGSIKASGSVLPEPLKFKGRFDLRRIPLREFDGYLPENLNLFIADGAIDTQLDLSLAKEGEKLNGSFSGDLGVRSFYCLDTEESEDLLKWESLQLDAIKGTISPFSLSINQVALNNVYSRIIVYKNGTLNLQNLVGKKEPEKDKGGSAPKAAPSAASQQPPQPSVAGATPPPAKGEIRIGTVTVQEGTLAFIDRHLKEQFNTTFFHLGGRVSDLTSQADRFADVDLRGNLENHSPLRITGTINPLRDDLFVDLKVNFTDIELTPMTPYSGTFLGYTVDKGKLFLDLKYRIDKKALAAENKVFIDQFTFGRKVESEKATNLPVRLAVALLKDRKGEIHLDLPVSGRTDDPEFSIWGVVWQVLKNLLVKAATSPFALLQSAFGSKDDFSGVNFAYGSATLSQQEQEKLAKLSQALNDRPELSIELSGFVEREKDSEGYRHELLQKKMRSEKFRLLVKEKKNKPGETQDSVVITPQEFSTYLKAVYKKESFPKPRNAIGMVKDIPDADMQKLIITNTQVGPEQLQQLARERVASVKDFLLNKGKLEPGRLFEKSSDIFKPPAKEGERGSRVEFGASVK